MYKYYCKTHLIEESLCGTSEGISLLAGRGDELPQCSNCNEQAIYCQKVD